MSPENHSGDRGTEHSFATKKRDSRLAVPLRRALCVPYTMPWAIMASATLRKPAMLAPAT